VNASSNIKLNKTSGVKELPGDFPMLNVTQSNNPTPGYIFLTNFSIQNSNPYGNYLLIVDNSGNPVFYRKMPQICFDFKLQPNGLLTYYDESTMKFYAMNTNYAIVDSFACGNGYYTDVHELRVLPNGNYFLLGDDFETVDMSQIVSGGNPNAVVEGNIIQELDKNGNVIFQWRSWDHFKITDATHEDLTQATIDYVHANAIEIEHDGNLLLSSRHMDEITNININTGDIIWRLGGKNNQFNFVNDPIQFSHQHTIRELPNGDLTLYDDGNYHTPPFSRGVEYKVDTANMTAALVWQYESNPDIYSNAMGSVQRLSNGNTLIGWGTANPSVIESTPDGQVALEMSLPENQWSYRAFRFPMVFLNSPGGGEKWQTYTQHNITWTSSGVDSVNIDYSVDGGATWNNIVSDYPADSGHYQWIVPAALSKNCKVKIGIADSLSIHENVVCDSAFTIDSSLSVQLLSFTSQVSFGTIQLNWTVAKEVNNSGFEVQRKLGIESWQGVGFVQSNGDSKSPVSYSFSDNLDTTAYVGKAYYRLKQIDLSGSAQYLKQIEMDLDLTPETYVLYNNYPNPFNPATVIKYSLPEDSRVIVKVYNVIGQLIKTLLNSDQTTGDHRVVFDGSNQASGVYFAVLKAESLDGRQSFTAAKKMMLLK
ncbi:MAG TPA: aryl-sulfate sulfotransferase, partial [Ignavibacteriaceae bacterium]|nr:aryl-sulfate sulfotransferase [Ignavibacteriaceae bacterium]